MMRKHGLVLGSVLGFGLVTTLVCGAQAQGAAPEDAPAAEPADAPAAEPTAAPAEPTEAPAAEEPAQGSAADGKQDAKVDEAAVADALEGVTESPDKTYLFLGARYRNVMIPEFVQHLFADGGQSLFAHTPGLEFAIRRAGFEYQLFTMLGFYSLADVPFKGSTDGNDAWEIIDADYKILYAGADFMWSTDEFTPGLSLTYGAGVGLGLVLGDLKRVQAFSVGDPNDPGSYERCDGVGDARGMGGTDTVANGFCNGNNNHYGDYVEPSWANGGSSPLFLPWMAGQVGLRYKAHKNFVAHGELGLMPTGAFLGLGADYGL